MAYADLTTEQKASIQALAQVMRGMSGELARLLERMQVVSAYYVGNVENDISSLDGSDLIPNTSGLEGAEDLTKAEFQNLAGYFIVASTTADGTTGSYNSNYHRALYARACGPINMIG